MRMGLTISISEWEHTPPSRRHSGTAGNRQTAPGLPPYLLHPKSREFSCLLLSHIHQNVVTDHTRIHAIVYFITEFSGFQVLYHRHSIHEFSILVSLMSLLPDFKS